MPAKFEKAPEVQEVAERLIPQYHDHLVDAKIGYFKRYGTWTSQGLTVNGKAVKVSSRDKFIHGLDFLIIVNADEWQQGTPEWRAALVDHELCHCQRAVDAEGEYAEHEDGSPVWTIGGHAVEEFPEVAHRHGPWNPALKRLAKILKRHTFEDQATLDDYDESGQIAAGPAVPVDAAEPGESMVAEGSEADADDFEEDGPLYPRHYCLKCRKQVPAREVTLVNDRLAHTPSKGECGGGVVMLEPGQGAPAAADQAAAS